MADDLQPLRDVIDGLLYPSESDEPWTVFTWPADAGATARDAVTAHTAGPIVERPIDAFFADLEATPDLGRYADLRATLGRLVDSVKVFRAGDGPEVGIYLIGRRGDGWAGLRTISVET